MSNPRVKNQVEVEQEAQNIFQRTLRGIGDGFGAVDDAYMGFMRDQVLRLPQEGRVKKDGFAREIRDTLGGGFFQARPGATGVNPNYQGQIDNAGDRAAMFANRAAHAGGLTAAGVGLAHLIDAMSAGNISNHFGSGADYPTVSELKMQSEDMGGRMIISPINME